MSLMEYHDVWLTFHPNRDRGWLKEKLTEGFDIHHIDGNHSNNDPENLILLEHIDHMRIHEMKIGLGRLSNKNRIRKNKILKEFKINKPIIIEKIPIERFKRHNDKRLKEFIANYHGLPVETIEV